MPFCTMEGLSKGILTLFLAYQACVLYLAFLGPWYVNGPSTFSLYTM